jgi:hypothetical protein
MVGALEMIRAYPDKGILVATCTDNVGHAESNLQPSLAVDLICLDRPVAHRTRAITIRRKGARGTHAWKSLALDAYK